MNQLQAMRVFTKVVDLSSFGLAGKQLGMSAAAVTRSIGMLEAHLNMRLLNRSTRSLSLTEAGQLYLDGCRAVLEKLDDMESELVRTTRDPSGVLRIASHSIFAGPDFATLLGAYRRTNPRVDFDVTVFESHLDLIEGGFDLCFAIDRQPVNTTLVRRDLTSIREIAVATPAYLSRRGAPHTPLDLAGHDLLVAANGPRTWEFGSQEANHRVAANGPLVANGYATVRAAALADMGIGVLPLPYVAEDLACSRLMPVLNQYAINGGERALSLVYPGRSYLSIKVRNFIDFAVERFRAATSPASPASSASATSAPSPASLQPGHAAA
ncbi:LysR family transcriptional regulator [Paraburkholderia ferrariae]|jgi:DNA-binding transcriptional LysR family regulator|uniref:LysR family transcriptional regulator n=1 Tax=Paraburkholderia ferrariae TaxID=386056 RepID=UPI0005AAF0EC|nr:LysR family transcriptional regulator [Paraburkholderia ferrariae]